ncbi:MAG: UvrD/REP helicase [Candidatus Magasanikbacteria bacterium GW2011_GWC2_37_14]|uniref:DNA 3'-5' helicase n=1 Tax=Candidatus Magasanikbacteria bacterium GW2011_GWC2_37_14 TaxID=1619046 RepID=A0A0G0GNC6_9BACT|nr:MAG: UvrD/REP helicase [Candidatus Magasanikbacteria bacterium GW2011_GWC2_37_14]
MTTNMIDFKKELNVEQLKVVYEGDGPCLVLAGAGSGKTRTITYRVAYLLEQGIKPENILLVTFTNKAAKEMIERVMNLVDSDLTSATPPGPLEVKRGTHLQWSGTFHHIGYRLLKKYALLLGYKNNFSVLDSEDSLALIKLCLKQEGIDRTEKRFPSPAVLQSIISYARNSEMTIEDVLDLKYEHFLSVSETIVRIAEDYAKRKQEANAMDFDDLLVNWYLLLVKEQGIKNKLAEQFQYILVDEYQDTNKIQASIIDLLASKHKNLLVVGDDAQSIYSFRAADIQNILSFSAKDGSAFGGEGRYPDAKVFKLETNYRSTPNILDLANNVISNNLNQYEKKLKSIKEKFAKPELQAFADQKEEAEYIANRIFELESEGVEPSKIAVLFRAAYHSQALEMELVKRGIDYDYRGGVRFFERAHIKDALAYLRIINNIEDNVAWRRVLNMQVGIGAVSAERIIEKIMSLPLQGGGEEGVSDETNPTPPSPHRGGNLREIGATLSAKAQIGWNDFLQIYEKLMLVVDADPTPPSPVRPELTAKATRGGKSAGGKPSDLILQILESKYIEYLENEYPDYRERMEDLQQLAGFAKQQPDLNTFLAEATLQESFRRVDTNVETQNFASLQRGGDKVVLSTIHQAKGLEWEAVFIIGLTNGQFPNDRALRENGGLEEERRLFYVAVTRAKKYLQLTYSLTSGWGDVLATPSLFLEELNNELLDLPDMSVGKSWQAGKSEMNGGTVFGDDPSASSGQDEIEYVSEDDNDVQITNSAKVRNNVVSFLKDLDEL